MFVIFMTLVVKYAQLFILIAQYQTFEIYIFHMIK